MQPQDQNSQQPAPQPLLTPPTPAEQPQPPIEPVNNQTIVMKQQKANKLKGFVSFILFIAGVLLTAFLINQFIFQSYFVDGSSMTPTLQNNDRLIIEKVGRSFSRIQGRPYIPDRGQIVVLDSTLIGVNGQEEQLIKRTIGLPGETVIIENGKVTIKNTENPNGFNVDEALGLRLEHTYADERIEVTIPQGHIYVMGDNRAQNGSYDSRAFGAVASEKLEGRLWARVLPLNNAKLFGQALRPLFVR